jgi:hypothetical protein
MKLSSNGEKNMKTFDTLEEEVNDLRSKFESLEEENPIEYRKVIMRLFNFTKGLINQDKNYCLSDWNCLESISLALWQASTCDELVDVYENLVDLAENVAKIIDAKNYDYSGEDDHDKHLAWRNA